MDDEQLLAIALQESEESYKLERQRKILEDRAIREEQELALQASLAADREKAELTKKNPETLEELRQARLKAFIK